MSTLNDLTYPFCFCPIPIKQQQQQKHEAVTILVCDIWSHLSPCSQAMASLIWLQNTLCLTPFEVNTVVLLQQNICGCEEGFRKVAQV